MVQIFRQMRFSCHFQNFAYFLAFSRYTFQNLNQRLHGICSQPLHDPWSTKKNNIITSSMKLLSIKYYFWSILAVFLWTFFIGPPNTKKKCITDMLRSVRVHWYHFHWGIKNFFSFPQNRGFRSFVPLIVLTHVIQHSVFLLLFLLPFLSSPNKEQPITIHDW